MRLESLQEDLLDLIESLEDNHCYYSDDVNMSMMMSYFWAVYSEAGGPPVVVRLTPLKDNGLWNLVDQIESDYFFFNDDLFIGNSSFTPGDFRIIWEEIKEDR